MARQNINRGTTANDGTGDTLRTAAGKLNDNFVELYTLLGGDSAQITDDVSLVDSGIQFNGLTYNTVLGAVEGTDKVTIFLPDSEGTVITTTAGQTLTNKTLTSPVLTTPQINDTSADHQYVFTVSELADDRIVRLPILTDSDTFAFATHTQTLTNKTLDSAQLNNPAITGHILDENQAELIQLDATASAVNHFKITNSATSGIPQISAHSTTDTDVGIGLSAQNAGLIHFQTGLRYQNASITTDAQAISLDRSMTIFNAGGAIAATLADGLYSGHAVVLLNEGGGNVTVTPSAFAAGTSFTIRQEGMTQAVWSGTGWHITVAKIFDSSDTDALIYITT